jgi:hypothetical protein
VDEQLWQALSDQAQNAKGSDAPRVLTRAVVIAEVNEGARTRHLLTVSSDAAHRKLKSWETAGMITAVLADLFAQGPE